MHVPDAQERIYRARRKLAHEQACFRSDFPTTYGDHEMGRLVALHMGEQTPPKY